jgi:adhesin/invasin
MNKINAFRFYSKRGGYMKKVLLLLMILIFIYSCGGGGSGSSSLPSTNPTDTGDEAGTIGGAASITLTATPSSLTVKGTSSITATVLDSSGANVPDGTKVYFTVSDSTLGTITASATTSSGSAIATFTASSTAGTITITAKSGNVSGTISITISAASAGSIEFVSAEPSVIGIKGSGQTETSTVKFLVKDVNGDAVTDGTAVDFTMNGPSGGNLPSEGGEYIGDSDSTPTTASGSTVNGYVSVILHSGKVAGTVTIIATVSGTSLSSSSSTISIGGGVASAGHFTLATTKKNLPGLVIANDQATITAYVADRFGNYNLLEGTSVSFYTEAGAIDRSNTTDSTGATSVTFRTQDPMPADVAIQSWETSLINRLNSTYSLSIPTDGSVHPRDGWVTVLAVVQGEEAFDDANGNGMYDLGESFTDLGEPFIDKDNDGVRDSSNPFEEYIDVNGNGQYDGPNGVWDGPDCTASGCQKSKMIWKGITLAFTGNYTYCKATPSSFSLGSGATQSFSFMVGDENTNELISGTTISVTTTVGTLSGRTSYTLIDGVPTGPTEISFTLKNATCTTCANSNSGTITVTVTPPSSVVGCILDINGTVVID